MPSDTCTGSAPGRTTLPPACGGQSGTTIPTTKRRRCAGGRCMTTPRRRRRRGRGPSAAPDRRRGHVASHSLAPRAGAAREEEGGHLRIRRHHHVVASSVDLPLDAKHDGPKTLFPLIHPGNLFLIPLRPLFSKSKHHHDRVQVQGRNSGEAEGRWVLYKLVFRKLIKKHGPW